MKMAREGSANANSVALRCGGRKRRSPTGGCSSREHGVGRLSATLLVALALTGCATPAVRYTTVYCVTQPQFSKLKSAEPGKIGSQLTGNAQDDVKLIAGNDVELRSYSDGLLGVLGGCVGPGK